MYIGMSESSSPNLHICAPHDGPIYADLTQHEIEELVEQEGPFPADDGLDDNAIINDSDTPLHQACALWQLEQAPAVNLLPL